MNALRTFEVPVEADPVAPPALRYGGGPAAVQFETTHGQVATLTFEKLDAIRVSRGEFPPYKGYRGAGWVHIVEDSFWLRERYEYERDHYGRHDSYGFNCDVDELLTEFSHYLFSFHDEFVEAIARGIWFQTDPATERPHPLLDLPPEATTETRDGYGIRCQVRRNSAPLKVVIHDARLCSQKLVQFAAELDGTAPVSWTLDLRDVGGRIQSTLRGHFGRVEKKFDGVATVDDAWPHVLAWLGQVRERRAALGKA